MVSFFFLFFFRKSLSDFLPYYAIGSNKLVQFLRHSSSEQRLLQQYEHASNKSNDIVSCQKQFLSYCRSIPFYGYVVVVVFFLMVWYASDTWLSIGHHHHWLFVVFCFSWWKRADNNFQHSSWRKHGVQIMMAPLLRRSSAISRE